MDVLVSVRGPGDIAARIYRQLRDAIEDGRLRPGDRLPSSRDLARDLVVARNTVATAYDALVAEGYTVGRVGAGTFVAADPRPSGVGGSRPAVAASPAAPASAHPAFDFRLGVPDPRLFPVAAWRRAMADAIDEALRVSPGYGDPAGDPGLRAAIARHVGVSRGVRATADDIVVTAGAQQAMDLVARVAVRRGDAVAVEDPGYPPARELLAAAGASVVPVGVDGEGLRVDALPADARLVYVTPSHQFPTGVAMSPARRAELLAWADAHDALVLEDDYDTEFRYATRPLEPVVRLDRSGRVVYVGSFSKTLLPMLRLGFLVAPARLLPALREARRLAGWHGDAPTQLAMRTFIDDGGFARHLRRSRRVYRARRDRLVAGVERDLAPWLRLNRSISGLHVCAMAAPGVDAADLRRVAGRAAELGVAVETLDAYAIGGDAAEPCGPAGLAMGFGMIDEPLIDEGIALLARAFAEIKPRRP
jgi:GntR family transcriptional regulator/MocR family aminotransferase